MRRLLVLTGLTLVALLLVSGIQARAQGSPYKPATVTIKVDDRTVLYTCQGVKVRISSNKDDFLGHSYFISEADVKALAAKRGVPCSYDAAARKLKLGTDTRDVIPPDPTATSGFAFGKVRQVPVQGRPYFDVMGLWSGLGFNSCSKMSYGFTMSGGKK